MPRLTSLLSFSLLALSQLPGGLAGPACARKHYKTADCVSRCKAHWGVKSGFMMNPDPWGSVVKTSSQSASLDDIIATACGTPATSSSSQAPYPAVTIAGAVGNNPTNVFSSAVAATSTVVDSSSYDVVLSSSSSSVSRSSSSSVSSAKPTTSTSTQILKAEPTSIKLTTFIHTIVHTTSSSTTSKAEPTTTSKTAAPAATTDASSSSSGSSSSNGHVTSASDIAAYLKGHNDVRAEHGASPLSWDEDLAAKAQTWANGCVFQHSHGSLGEFGENLAAGTGSAYGIPEAIKSWTDEVKDYDPSNPVASHFTQVVWKASQRVGCAVQSCNGIFDPSFGKAKFYVCEYDPPGNFNNDFKVNVQV